MLNLSTIIEEVINYDIGHWISFIDFTDYICSGVIDEARKYSIHEDEVIKFLNKYLSKEVYSMLQSSLVVCNTCGRISDKNPCYDCLHEAYHKLLQKYTMALSLASDLSSSVIEIYYNCHGCSRIADIDRILKDNNLTVQLQSLMAN